MEKAMDCLASGDFTTSVKAVIECSVLRHGMNVGSYRGLNDMVITNGPSSRVITLDVEIDGDPLTSYMCDGLIVATPVGSTGHSLSAGGPILGPETEAFVICLICPHTLSTRPLVVPDRSEVLVTVERCSSEAILSVDGQVGQRLIQGDRIDVRRSGQSARFIHLPAYSYFSLLRHKLRWSGRNV